MLVDLKGMFINKGDHIETKTVIHNPCNTGLLMIDTSPKRLMNLINQFLDAEVDVNETYSGLTKANKRKVALSVLCETAGRIGEQTGLDFVDVMESGYSTDNRTPSSMLSELRRRQMGNDITLSVEPAMPLLKESTE